MKFLQNYSVRADADPFQNDQRNIDTKVDLFFFIVIISVTNKAYK